MSLAGIKRLVKPKATAPSEPANPIVEENRRPGSVDWEAGEQDSQTGDDIEGQISAYASATSVNIGETIDFHVHVGCGEDYVISIYRLGFYNEDGGRLHAESPVLTGAPQPLPTIDDETGLAACDWSVSWTAEMGDDWVSGLYLAVFTTTTSRWRTYAPFVVTDADRRADICVVVPFATYQAYNLWPIDNVRGRSLYYSFVDGERSAVNRATKVSFDRPYGETGLPHQLEFDRHVIMWAEEQGYDLTYVSNLDVHQGSVKPAEYRAVIHSGHDEYWTREMRAVTVAAIEVGTSYAFLSANTMYWQVRLEPAADGRALRTLVCYKTTPDPDKRAGRATTKWRTGAPGPGSAEQMVLGVQYRAMVPKVSPLVVASAEHWFWQGTGAADGDSMPGLIGGEADDVDSRYGRPTGMTQTLLSASPYTMINGTEQVQTTSVCEAEDGTLVFTAGTFLWGFGLSSDHSRDERLRAATGNLVRRMLQPRKAPTPVPLADQNPTLRENLATGASDWAPSGRGFRAADDVELQIKAYASATSINVGESIDFHVSVAGGGDYTIGVYRMGDYRGKGARLIAESPLLTGKPQSPPALDETTGMISCDWAVGWTLRTDPAWVSGLHMAVFTTPDGWRHVTPFVVRDDSRSADFCVVLPFTTYQAYNLFPMDGTTGKSFYYGYENEKITFTKRAAKLSFDRPYHRNGLPGQANYDLAFIRWAESRGYDLTYVSSIDLHAGRVDPARYAGLIFSGHDEYWSRHMRDVVTDAVAEGTSLAFMSANNVYWHVRMEPSADGRDDRVIVCYKDDSDPGIDAAGATTQWRAGAPGPDSAEQSLLGIQYKTIVAEPRPLVIEATDHWFWAGSGAAPGDTIASLVAVEADSLDTRYKKPLMVAQTILAASPYQMRDGTERIQHTSIYETMKGAIVFVAGTFHWTYGLSRDGYRDSRVQVATENLLARIRHNAEPENREGWWRQLRMVTRSKRGQ